MFVRLCFRAANVKMSKMKWSDSKYETEKCIEHDNVSEAYKLWTWICEKCDDDAMRKYILHVYTYMATPNVQTRVVILFVYVFDIADT